MREKSYNTPPPVDPTIQMLDDKIEHCSLNISELRKGVDSLKSHRSFLNGAISLLLALLTGGIILAPWVIKASVKEVISDPIILKSIGTTILLDSGFLVKKIP